MLVMAIWMLETSSKPALARGNFNWSGNYTQRIPHYRKDAALERRMQPVKG